MRGRHLASVRFVGAQIGDVGGNGRRLGLERQRQAAERTMHVIGRKLFAARMAGGDAVEAGQQSFQFRLHFEHDASRRAARQSGT